MLFDGGVLGVSSLSPNLNPNDWLGVVSGSLNLSVKDGGAVIDTDNGSVTIRRPFLRDGTSTGGLIKTGRNMLTLAISNAYSICTYAGDTAVLGGTLKLGAPPAPLPAGTRLTVATDTLLDLNGVSQTVQRAATYQLSFSAANRPNSTAAHVELLVDGASVAAWGSAAFANGGVFKSYATNFTLSAGAHELKFQGTSAGGDTTTLIDDVRLSGYGASAPGTLPTNTVMDIAAGATLDLNATDQPLAGLSGSGLVTNGTLSVHGVIAPGGTNAVGTLTLAAAASLTGTLLIDVAQDGSGDLLHVGDGLDLSGTLICIR